MYPTVSLYGASRKLNDQRAIYCLRQITSHDKNNVEDSVCMRGDHGLAGLHAMFANGPAMMRCDVKLMTYLLSRELSSCAHMRSASMSSGLGLLPDAATQHS